MSEQKQHNINEDEQLLLVEDDPVFAQVLNRALQRRGFQVVVKSTVAKAQQWLQIQSGQNPSLAYVILDLKLESETSLPLIEEVKQYAPEAKILILTGYASIATAVEAMRLGATNYLPKPADTDEILNALMNDTPNPDLTLEDERMSVERLEWEHIQRVLKENDDNISRTARQLNMHRRTLQRKLQKKPVQK